MAEAHVSLRRALKLRIRTRKAIVWDRNALLLDSTLVMVASLFAGCYERIGDTQKKLLHDRRAIPMDPQDARSRQARERLMRQRRGCEVDFGGNGTKEGG